MGVTVVGKLNKAATQFPAGESTGFGVRVGVQYYDRKIKDKAWTNYKAVLFAKNPNTINYMSSVLVEDAVIELTGDKQTIEVYDGNKGPIYSIELLDAKLGFVYTGEQAREAQPVHQPPSQMPVSQPVPAPYSPAPTPDEFDDKKIPF